MHINIWGCTISKVFIIPDTHFPFHNKKAYRKMMKIIRREKPNVVIQIGDLLDQYTFSKYSRSMSISPEQDIRKGLMYADKMWKDIKKIVPRAKCYQLLGNHDVRIAKRISEKLPELAEVFDFTDLYQFKGVESLDSDRDYLEIDGVVYVHGWLSKTIDHAKYFNKPTVHGHRHRPAIEFAQSDLWSMDVGYLADKESLPLNYTMSKHSKWTLACGMVDKGQPRLFILE